MLKDAPPRWRFTADQYERMGRVGILDEDDRVELIDGEIVQMAPVGPPHIHCVNRLTRLLVLAAGERAVVQVQSPVRISLYGEPQPDLALLRVATPGEPLRVPNPSDLLLLVEVSDTTLRFDRRVKLPRYAAAGVPELWIVDLSRERLIVYAEPEGDSYRFTQTLGRGASVTPRALPGAAIPVAEILG